MILSFSFTKRMLTIKWEIEMNKKEERILISHTTRTQLIEKSRRALKE